MPAGLDGATDRVHSPARDALVESLAAEIAERPRQPNLLVGVDGASGTGKSTLADELTEGLADLGVPTIRASIDSFHRPRADRYARGADSPEGYYLDSHDLDRLITSLLVPVRAGDGFIVTAAFDEPTDQPLTQPPTPAPSGAVLVFDGLFLHRPELVEWWDLSIFLLAEQRRERAWQDYLYRGLPTTEPDRSIEQESRINRARRTRYVEGQALYEAQAAPRERAHLVIDNDDLRTPIVLARRRLG